MALLFILIWRRIEASTLYISSYRPSNPSLLDEAHWRQDPLIRVTASYMSEPSQSTLASVIPQLERATPPKTPVSANTQFPDIVSHIQGRRKSLFLENKEILMTQYVKSSRPDQQERNASKPIKASVKAASEQPSAALLASLGIKVRDFAYESKLPPIQPIYRHPRQIQPAVVRTTLKRQWAESGEDDYFSQSSSQPETSQKKLERTSTEPAIPPVPDSTDIDEYDDFYADSQPLANKYPESQQMPLSIFESQESEPYVDTPLVTPKGSLQWPVADTSNIPASQLDAESQSTDLEPGTHSLFNFSKFPKLPAAPTSPLAPLSSALSLASIDDSSKIIRLSPPRLPHGNTTTDPDQCDVQVDAPTDSKVLTMRYHLRRRPVTSLPAKPPSRLHNLRPRSAVIPPQSSSIQSTHSRAKPKRETVLRRGQDKRRRMS